MPANEENNLNNIKKKEKKGSWKVFQKILWLIILSFAWWIIIIIVQSIIKLIIESIFPSLNIIFQQRYSLFQFFSIVIGCVISTIIVYPLYKKRIGQLSSYKKRWQRVVLITLFVLLVIILLRIFVIQWFTMGNDYLKPYLKKGNFLIVEMFDKNIKRGDIVIANSEEDKNIVSIVIGLPNDKIELKNGTFFVNNEPLQDIYYDFHFWNGFNKKTGDKYLIVPSDSFLGIPTLVNQSTTNISDTFYDLSYYLYKKSDIIGKLIFPSPKVDLKPYTGADSCNGYQPLSCPPESKYYCPEKGKPFCCSGEIIDGFCVQYSEETVTSKASENNKPTPTIAITTSPSVRNAIPTNSVQNYPTITFLPQISSSGNHTCVALSSDNIKCWGNNEAGQLGNGEASATPVHSAVSVVGLTDVVKIYTGGLTTCALLKDNSIKCWGFAYPENSTYYHYYTYPVPLLGFNNIKDVSIGWQHICVLTNDDMVKCWGYNQEGELGDGSNDYKKEPVLVKGLAGVVSLSSGYWHSCVLLKDKTVECWGDNTFGQLGNGTTTSSNIPVVVEDLSDVKAISAGGWHTCALLNNGMVKCWGRNYAGELGDGTTNDKLTPVLVKGLDGDNVVKVVAGGFRSCVLLNDSTIKCWGEGYSADGRTVDFAYQAKTVVGLNNVQDIAVGNQHTCVLLADNSVKCWGLNTYGQIGEGTYAYYVIEPTLVVGL